MRRWFVVRPSSVLGRQKGVQRRTRHRRHPRTGAGSQVRGASGGPGRGLTGMVTDSVLVLGLVMPSLHGGGRAHRLSSGMVVNLGAGRAAGAAVQGAAPAAAGSRRGWREAYSPPRRRPGPRSEPAAAAERGPAGPAEGGEPGSGEGLKWATRPSRSAVGRAPRGARRSSPAPRHPQQLAPVARRLRGGVVATRGLGTKPEGCRAVSGTSEQVAEGCRARGMAEMRRKSPPDALCPQAAARLTNRMQRRWVSLLAALARFLPAWRR